MTVQDRLKEERLRLKYSQSDMADICGATKQGVSKWERVTAIPADKLALLAEKGVDAQYVVTGRRCASSYDMSTSLEARIAKFSREQQAIVRDAIDKIEAANQAQEEALKQLLLAVKQK